MVVRSALLSGLCAAVAAVEKSAAAAAAAASCMQLSLTKLSMAAAVTAATASRFYFLAVLIWIQCHSWKDLCLPEESLLREAQLCHMQGCWIKSRWNRKLHGRYPEKQEPWVQVSWLIHSDCAIWKCKWVDSFTAIVQYGSYFEQPAAVALVSWYSACNS